jgi:hypothetical protein
LVALEFFADPVAVGLAVATLHVGDDAFKHARNLIDASAFVIAEGNFLFARAIEKHLLHMGREIFPLGVFVKLVMFGNRLDGLEKIGRLALAPWRERTIIDFESAVRDNEVFVKEKLNAETVAVWACAEGRVEREQARLDLGDGEARDGASELLGKGVALRLALAEGAVSRIAMPSARSSAVRRLSARRVSMPSRITIRSTTTSMSWRNFLSSVGGSSSS